MTGTATSYSLFCAATVIATRLPFSVATGLRWFDTSTLAFVYDVEMM